MDPVRKDGVGSEVKVVGIDVISLEETDDLRDEDRALREDSYRSDRLRCGQRCTP